MSKILIDTDANATSLRRGMGAGAMFQATVYNPTDAAAAVAATVVIEVTNDNLAWLPVLTLSPSGTGVDTKAEFVDPPWDSARAVVSGLTAGARAIVTFNTKPERV